jgi:phosphate-selective porin OprO/OprP
LKGRNSWFAAGTWIALGLALAVPAAGAEDDKSVSEKILDILLEEGTIDRGRYEALKAEAEAERRAAALPPVAAAEPAAPDPQGWKAYWKDGARIERNDGMYAVKFGGRIQFDMAAVGTDDDIEDEFSPDVKRGTGDDFRRARLFVEGEFAEHGIFKAEYDFAGGEAAFKDVYAGLRGLPYVGTVRFGHFYEPMSLEMSTSSKYITFLERSLPVLAFLPERSSGIGMYNQLFDERMTFHMGGFREVGDDGEGFSNSSDYNAGARVTALPVWNEDGRQLVHTGFWYSHQFRGNDQPLSYDPDAESNTLGSLTALPELEVNGVDLSGAELAFVAGPVSVQGEFIASFVDRDAGQSRRTFYGSYLTASWFLTGESRAYDREYGIFTRTRPATSFSLSERQWGAFELAARWSFLDLNDGSVRGGILNDYSVGLNWYLYSNLRLMTDYLLAHRNGVGDAHVLQSRVSIDF